VDEILEGGVFGPEGEAHVNRRLALIEKLAEVSRRRDEITERANTLTDEEIVEMGWSISGVRQAFEDLKKRRRLN
jgi:uncharacterized coiled-coil DUF342 family protein